MAAVRHWTVLSPLIAAPSWVIAGGCTRNGVIHRRAAPGTIRFTTLSPTLAPATIGQDGNHNGSTKPKPTLYMLDKLSDAAIAYARTKFNVVLQSDPAFKGWQEKAKTVLVRTSAFTEEEVAKCPNLLAVTKQGVGIDNIAKAACDARGIKILNAPGANAQAVAEMVVALTLASARNIGSIAARQLIAPVSKMTCNGITLFGKTVGIIGMGNIGRRTAETFHRGFNMGVIAYDPFQSADVWSDVPHKRFHEYRDLLKEADVVSLHVPLTKETHNMIGYKEIRTMKRSAIIVNGARGGIINEVGLQRALEDGLIWGAGLDGHEEEPPSPARYGELWKLPNVVSTPHIGATTADAQFKSATLALDNTYAYLQEIGEAP
ncbi:d-3-phosphoglycerate dehydrogenase [Ophiostoma piceae UAMH 11346]|uniref:D-3-phosphoglycerate dehydrogenase n=1 Tax=Ophiostoma piceae (strain UAMH 11346) TaxID=1262450 RepID=S3BR39_OPHP1|nr:d-3-phosphoglycerate dehydrogenase [Ophiostoma piceae UAMH 11346]